MNRTLSALSAIIDQEKIDQKEREHLFAEENTIDLRNNPREDFILQNILQNTPRVSIPDESIPEVDFILRNTPRYKTLR